MKLTIQEAKHLIQDIEGRQEWDTLCEMEIAILHKLRTANPLAAAEIELERQRHQYEHLAKYNGELVKALQDGITWKDFQKARGAK